ncbi:MAG: TyeA family type III secretion system gatekeeper subunit [Verrucomicrobiota bacterium]
MTPSPASSPAPRAPVYTAHDLMKEILHMSAQRWTDPQSFAKIATSAGFRAIEARIYFLTQLRERLRMLPLKLFVSTEAREKMLEALQAALDQEISREDIA